MFCFGIAQFLLNLSPSTFFCAIGGKLQGVDEEVEMNRKLKNGDLGYFIMAGGRVPLPFNVIIELVTLKRSVVVSFTVTLLFPADLRTLFQIKPGSLFFKMSSFIFAATL